MRRMNVVLLHRHIVYHSEGSNLISKSLDLLLCHQHLGTLLLLQNDQFLLLKSCQHYKRCPIKNLKKANSPVLKRPKGLIDSR